METEHQLSKDEERPDTSQLASSDAYFRIEHWYPLIKEHTFPTSFMSLSLDEAKVLLKYREHARMVLLYQLQLDKEKLQNSSSADKRLMKSEKDIDTHNIKKADEDVESMLEPESLALLKSFTKRLDEAIKPFIENEDDGVFVKLSTRSPKDAAFTTEKMKQLLKNGIKNSKIPKSDREAMEIEDVILFTRYSCQALKVKSAQEALDLFLHSQRTYEDLMFCILHQGETNFKMDIVIRKWVNYDPEWEFRAFVYNHTLTACTQYYNLCYVPEIAAKKELIKNKIAEYFETVKHLFPIDSYTLDLAISPDLKTVSIIEINHTPPVAGLSLYNWESLEDRKIVHQGPYELRVLEKPVPDAKKQLHPPLVRYINLVRGYDDLPPENPNQTRCDLCQAMPISKTIPFTWYSCKGKKISKAAFKKQECHDFDLCVNCFEKRHLHVEKRHKDKESVEWKKIVIGQEQQQTKTSFCNVM